MPRVSHVKGTKLAAASGHELATSFQTSVNRASTISVAELQLASNVAVRALSRYIIAAYDAAFTSGLVEVRRSRVDKGAGCTETVAAETVARRTRVCEIHCWK